MVVIESMYCLILKSFPGSCQSFVSLTNKEEQKWILSDIKTSLSLLNAPGQWLVMQKAMINSAKSNIFIV